MSNRPSTYKDDEESNVEAQHVVYSFPDDKAATPTHGRRKACLCLSLLTLTGVIVALAVVYSSSRKPSVTATTSNLETGDFSGTIPQDIAPTDAPVAFASMAPAPVASPTAVTGAPETDAPVAPVAAVTEATDVDEAPVASPVDSPVASPVAVDLFAAPVLSPIAPNASPAAPYASPVAAPDASPVADSEVNSFTAPVAAPVDSPVAAPTTEAPLTTEFAVGLEVPKPIEEPEPTEEPEPIVEPEPTEEPEPEELEGRDELPSANATEVSAEKVSKEGKEDKKGKD